MKFYLGLLKKVEKKLIYKYKNEKKESEYFKDAPIIFQLIYAMYDNYFNNLNFSILNFESKDLINIMINIIFGLSNYKEGNLSLFLVNAMDIFKKLESDKKLYKSNNINEEKNIIMKIILKIIIKRIIL